MPKAAVNSTGTIFNKSHRLLVYADDLDIIGRVLKDVTSAFPSIEQPSAEVGLVINKDKTKSFVSTSKESSRLGRYVNVDDYNFVVVDDFVYLDSAINKDNNVSLEIKR